MQKRMQGFALWAAAALFLTAAPAHAQDQDGTWEAAGESASPSSRSEKVAPSGDTTQSHRLSDAERQELEAVVPRDSGGQVIVMESTPTRLRQSRNLVVELGGGFSNYTGDLHNALKGGGNWDVRAILGASSPLALELGYFGAANRFENLDDTAIATAGEAVLRINLVSADAGWQPFIGGGVDYFRIDGGGSGFNGTDTIGFPVTAGLQFYPMYGFTIAARGSYRFLTDLLDDNFPGGNNWNAGLTLGASF